EQAQEAKQPIHPSTAMNCRMNTRGNRKEQRHQQGRDRELQRGRIPRANQPGDWGIEAIGTAEIALHDALHIGEILLAERTIEAEFSPQTLDIRRLRSLAQHLLHRVARYEVDQQKDPAGNHENNWNGIDDSLPDGSRE